MKTLDLEEEPRPICQDCGQEAVLGYVAGDRCARMIKPKPNGPWVFCGGRLDEEEAI